MPLTFSRYIECGNDSLEEQYRKYMRGAQYRIVLILLLIITYIDIDSRICLRPMYLIFSTIHVSYR